MDFAPFPSPNMHFELKNGRNSFKSYDDYCKLKSC